MHTIQCCVISICKPIIVYCTSCEQFLKFAHSLPVRFIIFYDLTVAGIKRTKVFVVIQHTQICPSWAYMCYICYNDLALIEDNTQKTNSNKLEWIDSARRILGWLPYNWKTRTGKHFAENESMQDPPLCFDNQNHTNRLLPPAQRSPWPKKRVNTLLLGKMEYWSFT